MARHQVVRLGRRRLLQGSLALAGLGLLAGCGIDSQPAKVPRVGYLSSVPAGQVSPFLEAVRRGLAEHGYVESQNIVIDTRVSDGKDERLPDLAAELVGLDVAAILAGNPTVVRAAQQASSTIPIIMVGASEVPVEIGLVASLNRPGGNVTGLTIGGGLELPAKRLQLLKEAIPGISRVAVLGDGNLDHFEAGPKFGSLDTGARSLGVNLQVVHSRTPEDFVEAFSAMNREQAQAFYVDPSPLHWTHRARLAELAIQHRLPSMYGSSLYADAALMVCGANAPDLWRQSATYVDKILKGAKPADLPVERPVKFNLIVNLKTAQALGLTIPQPVLSQATEVIQ